MPNLAQEKSFQRFFFRTTHPGKKCCTMADTCRQGQTIKTLATNINKLLQLQNEQQELAFRHGISQGFLLAPIFFNINLCDLFLC